ncbi:hypothetical protein VNO77_25973 [Canavalia gladiata]|uniref:Uncharacterized protein n=1 Tax=Canavalia gladiata TaxID=3824 RepID=A0AAN9KRI8_CANGL
MLNRGSNLGSRRNWVITPAHSPTAHPSYIADLISRRLASFTRPRIKTGLANHSPPIFSTTSHVYLHAEKSGASVDSLFAGAPNPIVEGLGSIMSQSGHQDPIHRSHRLLNVFHKSEIESKRVTLGKMEAPRRSVLSLIFVLAFLLIGSDMCMKSEARGPIVHFKRCSHDRDCSPTSCDCDAIIINKNNKELYCIMYAKSKHCIEM